MNSEMQDASTFFRTSLSLSDQIGNGNAINSNYDPMMTRDLQATSVHKGPPSEFNSIVFWSINALWFVLVVGVVIWIWKFNGAHYLGIWAQRMGSMVSDDERRNEQDGDAEKPVPPEARRTLLRDYFRKAKVHMVVGENDILEASRNSNAAATALGSPDAVDMSPPSETDDDLEAGVVSPDADCLAEIRESPLVESHVLSNGMKVLTRSLSKAELGHLILHTRQGDRLVPNCCAVCICPYEQGDDVVWSMNECCIHAFHEECVTEWLTKLKEGNSCPCCRSVFVDSYDDKPSRSVTSWRVGPHPMLDENVTSD